MSEKAIYVDTKKFPSSFHFDVHSARRRDVRRGCSTAKIARLSLFFQAWQESICILELLLHILIQNWIELLASMAAHVKKAATVSHTQ